MPQLRRRRLHPIPVTARPEMRLRTRERELQPHPHRAIQRRTRPRPLPRLNHPIPVLRHRVTVLRERLPRALVRDDLQAALRTRNTRHRQTHNRPVHRRPRAHATCNRLSRRVTRPHREHNNGRAPPNATTAISNAVVFVTKPASYRARNATSTSICSGCSNVPRLPIFTAVYVFTRNRVSPIYIVVCFYLFVISNGTDGTREQRGYLSVKPCSKDVPLFRNQSLRSH